MNADSMTYLLETLTTIERLGIVFDEMDLAPPQPSTSLQETPSETGDA